MEFTDEQILLLIGEYEKYPVLWDARHKFYELNNKKKDAWAEIAVTFKRDSETIKKKINSLLSSFRRKCQKEIKRSGMTENEVYKSKWFANQAFYFLQDKYQPRARPNTETLPPINDDIEERIDNTLENSSIEEETQQEEEETQQEENETQQKEN